MLASDLIGKENIFFSSAHKWKRSRHFYSETFKFENIKGSVPLILGMVKEKINELKDKKATKIDLMAEF